MHQEPKAWIYCRIDAPEDVHGMLKVQRKQLMDYAEQMGFQVKGSSTCCKGAVFKKYSHPGRMSLFPAARSVEEPFT